MLCHSRHAAASCLPPSLLCRIPQPVPPPLVVLLHPTCLVGCRVARWPPSASQSAPPPLFTPLHSLVVALHCVTLSGPLAFPPPLIMPPPLVASLLFGWLLRCVAWRPGLSPPPIAMFEMPLLLSSTLSPSVAAAASSPSPLPSPSLSPPLLLLPSLLTLMGEWGGGGF